MHPAVLTKRAKYNDSSQKSPAIQGILLLTEKRFMWVSFEPWLRLTLDHPYTMLKAHFIGKNTKRALLNLSKRDANEGFVFEFDNFPDRDACRDHVAKILGKQNPSGGDQAGGEFAKPSAPAPAPVPTPDLFNYAESMCWTPKQRVGLRNAMLADVRPLTDGRTKKVVFNLSSEIIRQIFSEKPAVHRAFLLNVPTKMTEVEFWLKYCRAEYLYQTKSLLAAVAETVDDEELALFMKDDDIIRKDSQQKMKQVDPTVDIAADLADDYTHLHGHEILRDGSKNVEASSAGLKKRSVITSINRHAAVVLEGRRLDDLLDPTDASTASIALAIAVARMKADKAIATDEGESHKPGTDLKRRRLDGMEKMTLNDDLQGPPVVQHVPLCTHDPRKYFESQQAKEPGDGQGQTSSDPSNALEYFHEQLSAFKAYGLREVVMTSQVALKVVCYLSTEMFASRTSLGKSLQKNLLDSLPLSTKDDILQLWAQGTELLGHYWASYPLTTIFLKNKANRLIEAMSQLYSQIQKMKENTPNKHRHQTSQLLQPILQALDAAFAHFEETAKQVASKAAQSHATQNSVFSSNYVRA